MSAGRGRGATVPAAGWEAVKALFAAALEQPPAERAALLADAAANDPALHAEVVSLLAAHADDGFLERPAFEREAVDGRAPGRRVGAYRLVRELGRGGMGAVYLAARDDDQFRQTVAVKLIKRGMDSDAIVGRFRRERQILAELDHPNVARLLDGGTTEDGLPYFVMEYVDGEPIDRWCDARGLGVAERLALFRQVCAAVHYAHQRLVVHRDLKPANVLVTRDGVPKLLDFGIATLLHDRDADRGGDRAATATGLLAMTPDYASPEQVLGAPTTTLTDVYSLGVVLYRLVAGRAPYRVEGARPEAIARAVLDAEPPPPSAVATRDAARLRGDVDTIVLAALRKEPERRYASAEQLSEDIRRHLAGLPVLARPSTFRYRAAKFVRRNRLGVATAALGALALVGGAAAAAWQAHVAREARGQADRRFAEVRQLATSFLFELDSAIAPVPGTTTARELLVRRARESLDGLARESRGDPSLRRELAAAYLRVGDAQGKPYTPNLGQTGAALASYRRALAILEPLAREHPGDAGLRQELSAAYRAASAVQARSGDLEGAIASARQALATSAALLAAAPSDAATRRLVSQNELFLGRALYQRGDEPSTRAALAAYRRGLAIREALAAETPGDPAARGGVASGREYVSYALWRLGDLTGDTASYRAALASLGAAHEIRVAIAAARPGDVDYRRGAVDGLHEMAELHLLLGEPAAALRDLLAARPASAALAAIDPTNAEGLRDLAAVDAALASTYHRLRAAAPGLAAAGRARAALERVRANDPTAAEDLRPLARVAATTGDLARDAGDGARALASYEEAVRLAGAWARRMAASAEPPRALAAHLASLAAQQARLGARAATPAERASRVAGACAAHQRADSLWRRLAAGAPLAAADARRARDAAAAVARCRAVGTPPRGG